MYQPDKSPFPYPVPRTGALITDERCKCGALRSEHERTLSYGHGPRLGKAPTLQGTHMVARVGDELREVLCERFTWIGHVFTSQLVGGRAALDDVFAVDVKRASERAVGAKGWRIQVYDMSRRAGGSKAFNTIAVVDASGKTVRTRADAIAWAKVELQAFLKRAEAQTTIGGVS